MTQSKRILICTFVALASSLLGFAMGGSLQAKAKIQLCDRYSWGWSHVCQAWTGPTAWLQGSTTGLWMGMVLGAFLAGLGTSADPKQGSSSHRGDASVLTSEEQAKIKRLLLFLDEANTSSHFTSKLTPKEQLILALGKKSGETVNRETLEQLLLALTEDSVAPRQLPGTSESSLAKQYQEREE